MAIEIDIPWNLVIFVIGVFVVILLVFAVALPYFQKNFVLINECNGGSCNQNQYASADLLNAMKCAYYRCSEGCGGTDTKAITVTWPDSQTGNAVSCADFCKSGKPICGTDSESSPVTVDMAERSFLSDDILYPIVGQTCISDSITANLLVGVPANAVILNFAYIDQSSVQYTKTTCSLSGQQYFTSYASLYILPGKFRIFMYNDGGKNKIYILPYQPSSSTSSPTISYGTCAEQGGQCTTGYDCPAGTRNLGRLNCLLKISTGGIGQVCCK
jgi:hypothetical protein